jgi:GTP-binding protein Era
LDEETRDIIEKLKSAKLEAALALNKIDLMPREKLLGLSASFSELYPFPATFMISASKGSGVADLKRHIADKMPVGPWLYPEDQIADVPLRFLASEITREKIYERLHEELPYSTTVETEAWEERKDGSVKIDQVIYVERDGQKKIVLGKGGQQIKVIGQLARKEIEEMLGRRAHLFLFVKVRENWTQDPERLAAMGLGSR